MLVRGPSSESRMSRWLIDQIGANAAINVRTSSQIARLHGESSLTAIEVLDLRTGTTSMDPMAAVFVMIGDDAVTDGLGSRRRLPGIPMGSFSPE